jgi:hypothetical protein
MIPQANNTVFSPVDKDINAFCCTKSTETLPQPFAKIKIKSFYLVNPSVYEV